jgi:6-phosphogluconolactonase (cycloisomerase 2 family)
MKTGQLNQFLEGLEGKGPRRRKRMKFSKLSQLFLVSITGLLVASLLTACQIVTIDYVFLASPASTGTSSNGQIEIFAVDSESGALRAADTAASSGGISPVSLAVTSNYENLYVANQGSDNVAHMAIANNGSLTQKDTVTLKGPPAGIAVNAAGTFLYVITGVGTGPDTAILTSYSLSSDGTIGSATASEVLTIPGFEGDVIIPTGVTVLANNNAVYVTVYDQSAYNPGGAVTSTANPGWIFGFSAGSGGALTPAVASPWKAGIKPTALAADPTNRFVYVTDFASNELIGYAIYSGSVLEFLINGPFKTGNEPQAVVIDPRGKYIYVANALDSTVFAYAIDLATGTPSVVTSQNGTGTNVTDTEPVAILVDPALGRFVYTANHLGNSLSGFRLNPNTGALTATQVSPYPSAAAPTAIVSVPHGSHSLQSVTP